MFLPFAPHFEDPWKRMFKKEQELQWHDLEKAIQAQKTLQYSVAELKQVCKEKWSQIPPKLCSDAW